MINVKSIAIAGGTVVLAAGAGIYMQMGSAPEPAPQMAASVPIEPVADTPVAEASDVEAPEETTDVAATPAVDLVAEVAEDQPVAIDMAALPKDVDAPKAMDASVELAAISLTSADTLSDLPNVTDMAVAPVLAAASDDDIPNPDTNELSAPVANDDCIVDLTGETRAAAMIALSLSAPCQPNERVSFQHGNLTFTVATDDTGAAQVELPALAENALIIATLDDGNAAAVEIEVDTLSFYDRAVVQWQGDAGIELHAREFGADYDSEGHVWSGAPRDASVAARGIGGFVTMLGDADVANAAMAEVYTFPTGTATTQGDIELTVEVAVTEGNCNRAVSAQVIEVSEGIVEKLSELDVTLPDCDAVGDYLLLKNLVEDLKIAAK